VILRKLAAFFNSPMTTWEPAGLRSPIDSAEMLDTVPHLASTGPDVPKVLIFAVRDWHNTAFLASSLAQSGFIVGALCTRRSALRYCSKVNHHFTYIRWRALACLRSALSAFAPDLIVCGEMRRYT
jgi:hypothetical protein